MNLKIHIDRLTVEGISHSEAMRVGRALQSHLTELASAGLLPRESQIKSLDAGELPRGAGADHIGRHLAGQIFQKLKGPSNA
jgi:hypothetical protein